MAEISDDALAELRQAHALLKSLYGDSSVGFDFRKLVKKKFPNISIPDLEAVTKAEEVGSGISTKFSELETNLTKKVDAFLEARQKEKEEADVNAFVARIDKIVKDRGYTKEGTEKFLGLMKDRGIQHPEDAAILFESSQPKPESKPRAFSSRMNFIMPDSEKDEQFQRLMDDPDQFMADELMSAIGNANSEE